MNIVDAEKNLKKISENFSKETFIFDLLIAYDFPKSTISKLKIKYKNHADIVVPSKLHFVGVSKKELDSKFDELVKHYSTAKKAPRFVIVTDYQSLKAYDTKVAEKLDAEIKNLSKHPDFFLPWAGIEKKVFQGENPADVKAAEKLAKFFDLILKDNLELVKKNRHALNVFLTRILFGFFAEDTDIFKKGLFTESIASHTKADGSDLDDYLKNLFEILNTHENKRPKKISEYLNKFPYVNGGLFAEEYPIPKFSKKSRESFIDLGSDLNWAEINPDIFGSMIQAVVHPDQRAGLGMHYTSVTNIMKVIEPLFLTELKEEFFKAKGSKSKLKKLLERISNIKIFDPACGSGNFLIIAYKELRLLEMDILKSLGEIPMSGISLSSFYGIEIDDFAHEVAKLSLWLAEHQMDVLFNREFGDVKASLPLKDTGYIVCGNSARINWNSVLNSKGDDEIYIVGNPPYLGARQQDPQQKEDIEIALNGVDGANNLDLISIWFHKGANYIRNKNAKLAFVTTNSICQGEQVSILWPHILTNLEIHFAHLSFRWTNNAKNSAAVTCSILGLRNPSKERKFIFTDGTLKQVSNINAYLVDTDNVYIDKRRGSISNLMDINYGSFALDDGHYTLSTEDKRDIEMYQNSSQFIKKFVGAKEMLQGIERFCLWITDKNVSDALKNPEIKNRVHSVQKWRAKSERVNTIKLAETPHLFAEIRQPEKDYIAVPTVSSERREYMPVAFYSKDVIASNQLYAIEGGDEFHFGLLSSKMHMVWIKAVSGRMKTDPRYSSAICYNNFPVPNPTDTDTKSIKSLVHSILKIRGKYSSHSLAELYDPDKMPLELLEAHQHLDAVFESLYRNEKFTNDFERLECLFKLYLSMNEDKNE